MKKLFVFILLMVGMIPGLAQSLGRVKQGGGYTNVRRGPGSNYDIVGKVKDGSDIYYGIYNKSWCKVYNSNKLFIGYIHTSKIVKGMSRSTIRSSSSTSSSSRSWMYGRWTYSCAYGVMAIYLEENNIRVYYNGQLAYKGKYSIYDGGIHFPDTFIEIDYNARRLKASASEYMIKH